MLSVAPGVLAVELLEGAEVGAGLVVVVVVVEFNLGIISVDPSEPPLLLLLVALACCWPEVSAWLHKHRVLNNKLKLINITDAFTLWPAHLGAGWPAGATNLTWPAGRPSDWPPKHLALDISIDVPQWWWWLSFLQPWKCRQLKHCD